MASQSELKSALTAVPDAAPVTSGGNTIFDLLEGQQSQFVAAMNNEAGARRLTRILMTEIRRNPKLGECTPASLLGAAMMCAQVNLEPGHSGLVYLVPRWSGKLQANEVNWQLGYKGMIELALRTNKISSMMAMDVRDKDVFHHQIGFEPEFVHRIDYRGDRGPAYAYYSHARLADGVPSDPMVLDMEEIYEARSLSEAWRFAESGPKAKGGGKKDSIWHTFEPAMAKKTAVRRHWSWLPKSFDMIDADAADEAVITVEDPEQIRPDEIVVTREELLGGEDETPSLDSGPVKIHPAPTSDEELFATPPKTGGVSVDELIDVAREVGHIPTTARPASARKALNTIAAKATGQEWEDLETAASQAGQQIADYMRSTPAEETA